MQAQRALSALFLLVASYRLFLDVLDAHRSVRGVDDLRTYGMGGLPNVCPSALTKGFGPVQRLRKKTGMMILVQAKGKEFAAHTIRERGKRYIE